MKMGQSLNIRIGRAGRLWPVLFGACLLLASGALHGQSVDQYLREIERGQVERARSALPGLLKRNPNDPGVKFLQGMLETDGDKAYQIFKNIANRQRYTPYRDDAILKVGEYLFAKGLYLSAENYLQKIPVHYPRSPHMEQAANLLVNSMAAAGKVDSSQIMARVLQRQYPKITITMGSEQIALSSQPQSEPEENTPPEPVDLSQDNPYYHPDDSEARQPDTGTDTESETPGPPKYAIQVGAFSTLENAIAGKEIFEEHDYPVQVRKRSRNDTQLYLVWVGEYDTRAEAEKVGEDIRKKLALPFFIVETQE